MKETPILFNTEMVMAILAGRKTKTRRLNGLKGINENPNDWKLAAATKDHITFISNTWKLISIKWKYKPGDLLWVRETWTEFVGLEETSKTFVYRADGMWENKIHLVDEKWKPSLLMPKSACRLWLQVKNIRVERLQDITEEDAKAEGVTLQDDIVKENNPKFTHKYRWHFCLLWNSINKKTYPWESNPWVWVIEFEQYEK
jgi:hypothetical protein